MVVLSVYRLRQSHAARRRSRLRQDDGRTGVVLSNGGKLPLQTEETEPINILYQTAEDGLADTIIPRLLRFGANMERISAIRTDKYLTFSNREQIEQAIVRKNIRLMIFDPFQAFVGKANMSSANDMRSTVREILEVAQKHKCAVIITCHTSKSANYANLLQRILGSVDIGAIDFLRDMAMIRVSYEGDDTTSIGSELKLSKDQLKEF